MADVPITVSISRASLPGSPAPLVLSGTEDGTLWGIVGFRTPGRVRRYAWLPDSPDVDGSVLVSSSLQQGLLSVAVAPDVTSESALQTALGDLYAALGQWSYTVTTTAGGAPAQAWSANPGSIELAEDTRDIDDLADSDPVYAITIPVYPIPA